MRRFGAACLILAVLVIPIAGCESSSEVPAQTGGERFELGEKSSAFRDIGKRAASDLSL